MRTINYLLKLHVNDYNQDLKVINEILESCEEKNIKVVFSGFFDFENFYSDEKISNLSTSMEMLVDPKDKKNLVEKMATEISKLKNDKQLLIIDPYFFDGGKKILNLFIQIAKKSELKPTHITIVSRESERDKERIIEKNMELFKDLISDQFGINVKIQKTDEFHDRYWLGIENNSGIVIGTSLNGLTSKLCLVQEIDKEDVKEIIKFYSNLNLREI